MVLFSTTIFAIISYALFAGEPAESSQPQLEKIISSMSQIDKIYQMAQIDFSMLFTDNEIDQKKIEHYFGELGIGSLLIVPYQQNFYPATFYRSVMIQIQNVTKSFNRPPVIAGIDSVHGANYIKGATIFPQPINIASTWEPSHAWSTAVFGTIETVAAGINWLFSPIVGLGIQPLWSRMYETFGEDPYLVGIFATEMVNGIQGNGAAACAKHFVGYSAPRTGHDRSPSWIPVRHLYQYFVRPWREVINYGHPMTIMESYTEYDGVPNMANRNSLETMLRQDLGFDGMLVTDYQEIENLIGFHKVAIDINEAVELALLETSVDMSMLPFNIEGWVNGVRTSLSDDMIEDAVKDRIDRSVMRILRLKDELDMFDTDLTEEIDELKNIGNMSTRAVALNIARDSIVLTKNTDKTLPLPKSRRRKKLKIHVTGPTSNSIRYQSGGWSVEWQGASSDEQFTYGQTVLQAATEKTKWQVTSSCGVNIVGDPCDGNITETANQQRSAADYIFVCIGEENYTEKPGDIRDLSLPRGQIEYVQSLKKSSNAKIVVVYFGGRPRLLGDIVENSDAILIAFLPGPDGGKAVIDLIAGDNDPSGRLPITYPKYQDGGGVPYWHAVSDQCTATDNPHEPLPHWAYTQCEVQWPFGHGLSYTDLTYSNLRVDTNHVIHHAPWDNKAVEITVSVDVKNTGDRVAHEPVMFFIYEESRHVTPEYKRLVSFERMNLSPDEERTMTMTVMSSTLLHVGPHDDKHDIMQIGQKFRIGVGSATDCRNGQDMHLCTDTLSLEFAGQDSYDPVCEASCLLLSEHGCLWDQGKQSWDQIEQLSRACYSMCIASSSPISKDDSGWGWNYLNCIESILKDSRRPNERKCNDVNMMCRDVFHSEDATMSPMEGGKVDQFESSRSNFSTIIVSIFAGIIGTLAMFYPCYKHVFFQHRKESSGAGEIEFMPVIQDEEERHARLS